MGKPGRLHYPVNRCALKGDPVLRVLEALATPHGIDRYLELVNPMLTVRELRAEVTDVAHPTADSVALTLRPTRQWRGLRAGQYVQLTVDIDGVRRTRCYSPCGSERDGHIELTVKAQGLVSRYLYEHARPGLVVGLAQASGTFTLPGQRPDKIVLISGGSGITPVLSMRRTLQDERYAGDVVHVHYARTRADVPHDGPTVVETSRDGHFHEDHLPPWYRAAQTYLCGPRSLMDDVRRLYEREGIQDRLHTEEFTPVLATGDEGGEVRFTRSGVTAPNTGASLLDQAEAAGLTPEHGCRMGICFSCTSVKTHGCTRNLRTGETNSDPDTEIQLCISAPVGDVAIDI